MRKLQVDRRNEVKALTQKHRDRDELVRMKREVASSLVGRGVTERLRLAQAFEKRRENLQRQHDLVKANLHDHRTKVGHGIAIFQNLYSTNWIGLLTKDYN